MMLDIIMLLIETSVNFPWYTRMIISLGLPKGFLFFTEQRNQSYINISKHPTFYWIQLVFLTCSRVPFYSCEICFLAHSLCILQDYTTKLSDFGLAKHGPQGDETHVLTWVMGTHGYATPKYVITGKFWNVLCFT